MTYASDPGSYWALLWSYNNIYNDLLDSGIELGTEHTERYEAIVDEIYRLSEPVSCYEDDYWDDWAAE